MAAVANKFISPQVIKSATAVATNAGTDVGDAPTNTVKLIAAGPNGARYTKVSASPRATVSATQLRLFRSSDGGVTKRWFKSELMAAQNVGSPWNTKMVSTDLGYSDVNPLMLGANEEVYVSIGVALLAGIVFDAEGGDF